MFYFDKEIEKFEDEFEWDKSIDYLDKLFNRQGSIEILNSLIGFSWYYLIEGPIESKKYNEDNSVLPLQTWKKYIDYGLIAFRSNEEFRFIAGYTLSLHGFYIGQEYEDMGIRLMESVANILGKESINSLAKHFMLQQRSGKLFELKDAEKVCNDLFCNNSKIEKYFKELYLKK